MIIKTINPIFVNGAKESRPSEYLSFDASKSTPDQIKEFQEWHNMKKYTPKLVESGILDAEKNTEKAISKYGSEFDKELKTFATGGNAPSKNEQIEQAKKGKIWDKAKGWVKSEKAKNLLFGLGGILGGLLGGNTGGGGVVDTSLTTQTTLTPPILDTEKGWSTGKKVLVFGGGALVLGLIIYFATKKD